MYVLGYPCDFSSWWNVFCVSEFIMCLNCVSVKYSDICAKQTTEGAAGSHLLRRSSGKSEQGATRDVIAGEPVGCPCGSSLVLQSIPVALGCFSWLQAVVPGWESSKCWTPETLNGVGLILAFGTAGFSDHEAAQAVSLTWLLPLFPCSKSLLIFDCYVIFSRTLTYSLLCLRKATAVTDSLFYRY